MGNTIIQIHGGGPYVGCVSKILWCGVSLTIDLDGRQFRRCVAVWRASTQYAGGR